MPLGLLFGIMAALILISGFFSSSETSMMSLNKYRLRHMVNSGNKRARRVDNLLRRPDRLIGIILIGNNLVNIFAAQLATLIAIRLYGEGEGAILLSGIVLTLIILIFAEVTPKTMAALRPEKIAFPASYVLRPLLKVLYPAVWLVNYVSNALARLFGVDPARQSMHEHLHPDELRTVVNEAGDLIPDQHQGILLNVLDLEKSTVEDIMIPRNEVFGLDLEDDVSDLLKQIRTSSHTRLPVYEGDINKVVGVLHLRNAARFIHGDDDSVSHEAIRRFSDAPYFVPEGTPLHIQLMNFQKEKHRTALVVDEYGDVMGLVTMEDLLEEIVGEFTTNVAEVDNEEITPIEDGGYEIDAGAYIRDINKELNWDLPTDGPKTLNGLIIEHLEHIPEGTVSVQMGDYLVEITERSATKIETARVYHKQ